MNCYPAIICKSPVVHVRPPGHTVTTVATHIASLPFTGLNVISLVAVGCALLILGHLMLRRVS